MLAKTRHFSHDKANSQMDDSSSSYTSSALEQQNDIINNNTTNNEILDKETIETKALKLIKKEREKDVTYTSGGNKIFSEGQLIYSNPTSDYLR